LLFQDVVFYYGTNKQTNPIQNVYSRVKQLEQGTFMKSKLINLLIPFLGLSLMGNKGCQKEEPRILRMDVEIGHIRTLPLKVERQEEILIDQLTRELFSRTIYAHNHFSVVNTVSEPGEQTFASNSSNLAGDMAIEPGTIDSNPKYGARDQALLEDYGFIPRAADSSKSFYGGGEVPNCEWEKPQLDLNSDVLGFELVNRTGIGVGYSPSGTHLDELRGKIKFVNFRLDYSITAIHPLLQRLVASTEAVEYKTSVELEFDFGQNAPITVDFFHQEAMTKVIREGMKKSLDQLIVRLEEQTIGAGKDWNQDIWESRVLLDPAICDSTECVAIRGGSLNRIKLGDRFSVTNMIHTWEGEPCASNLIRSIPDPASRAEIVIESVGDAVSVGRVLTNNGAGLTAGGMVKVTLLNEPKPEK
jgi:hypothetical protein